MERCGWKTSVVCNPMKLQIAIGFVLLVLLLAGCTQPQQEVDESVLCAKIPSVLEAENTTVIGALCSDSFLQLLSTQEQSVLRGSRFSGVLEENKVVEFSCTVTGNGNSKSFRLNYLFAEDCEGQCSDRADADNVPQADCILEDAENAFVELVATCPANGFTGPQAVPRNRFEWSFDAIQPDSCDASNPDHINCDMVQFLIAFFHKMQLVQQVTEAGTVSVPLQVEKAGVLSPSENGFSLSFEAAFLSDNLSDMLLLDFGEETDDFFSEPSWYKEQWRSFLQPGENGLPLSVQYDSDSFSSFRALHEAGIYDVTVQVNFLSGQRVWFTRDESGVHPNATIRLVLERGRALPDAFVMDIALDGKVGSDRVLRDYGNAFLEEDGRIVFRSASPGKESVVSDDFRFGLELVHSPAEEAWNAPLFYAPWNGNGARGEETFFNNAPVLLQTTETVYADADSGQKTDRGYALVFQPGTAVPLLAQVQRESRAPIGTAQGNAVLFGPWVPVALAGNQCLPFPQSLRFVRVGENCGTQSNPNAENGWWIENPFSVNRWMWNVAWAQPQESEALLQLCSDFAGLYAPGQSALRKGNAIALSDAGFSVHSIAELLEGIRNETVCAYPSRTVRMVPENGTMQRETTRSVSYLFNANRLLNALEPEMTRIAQQPGLRLSYCSQ